MNHNITLIPKIGTPMNGRLFCMVMLTVGLLTSCGKKKIEDEGTKPAESEAVESLRKEVIAVHDEVMPLMTDIYQEKKRLREKISDGSIPSDKKQELEGILTRLDSADQGMRVWMRTFSTVETGGMPEEEALEKLREEMNKVNKVKKDMTESVRDAKAVE